MNRRLFAMEYYDTYYFANILHGLLTDSFPFLRTLDEFFGDLGYQKFLTSFPKHSALHKFIEFVIETDTYESIDDVVEDSLVYDKDYQLWVNNALKYYGIEHVGFRSWLASRGTAWSDIVEGTIFDYHAFLRDEGPYEQLLERISEEVFFLMFMNREFLRKFNEMIAFHIASIEIGTLPPDEWGVFKRSGVLKRTSIPVWARRSVFYRDRGLCGFCHRDISGLVSIHSDKHYDHIVPLARGGINDVSNLQLLCSECNMEKRDGLPGTSKYYERWFT